MFWPMFDGDRPLNPEEILLAKEREEAFLAIMEKVITPRQRVILEERLGLNCSDPRTLASVGKDFAIGRERVRQIHGYTIRKLRRPAYRETILDYLKNRLK